MNPNKEVLMKIGDLVKYTGLSEFNVTWLGIITMERYHPDNPKVFVVWTTGGRAWQYCSELEVL